MKKSVLIILAILCVFTLTGCHGSRQTNSFTVPEEFDTQKNIELTFWAKNDTNKAQTNIYERVISDFERLYPNITVNVRFYTNYVNIYNDVITNIATQTTPNVCITYPDNIATYKMGENVVVPLDELIDNPKYGLGGSDIRFKSIKKDEVIKEYLDEGIIGGEMYAIPFMRSTEACYINKTYVEKLGYTVPDVLTWDFIWEVSEKAMEKNADGTFKVNDQNVLIPFIYKSTDNMMIQYLAQNGDMNELYSTEGGGINVFNDTTKDFLLEIADHARSRAFSTFKISSYPANFLNAGQCIFAVDSTAGATWMGSEAPLSDIDESEIVDFETVVRMVPQVDAGNPKMISQGPSICVFNKKDPQVVLASWLFAQYLLNNDVQIAYSQTEGYVPVTHTARESREYVGYINHEDNGSAMYYPVKLSASRLLLDNTDKTFTTAVFNGSASLREASGQLIETVVKSERRKQTITENEIDGIYSDVISLYRLDSIEAGTGKADLGKLPVESRVLLIVLAAIWVIIGIFATIFNVKKRKI